MSLYSKFINEIRRPMVYRQSRKRRTWGSLFSAALLLVPFLSGLPAEAAAPTVTTYPVPTHNAYANQITKGPDGALWFTENESNKIGQITSSGVITEYPVPGGYFNPNDIVAGSDGALWFTEVASNFLYRMTTTGTVTTYNAHSYPRSLTAGSDGALWFTSESFTGNVWSIGRMTTAGDTTIYPAPSGTAGFMNITSGSDGALWFAEQGNDPGDNAIGRMSTAGVYSRYLTPTAGSFPFGITSGPDGALWFTETEVAKIARIDTSGTITEYSIPSGENPSAGITSGPDGAIWYTSGGSVSVGRVTMAGAITQYALPTDNVGSPAGITTGFDGALWYAQAGATSVIGRIALPAPVALRALNAGGNATGAFGADADYDGGSTSSTTAAVDTSQVSAPAPQSVYQSARYGNAFSYSLSGLTPGADYTLRLHFNELYWGVGSNGGGVGSRVFNVMVNGQSALTNYDIYRQAGGADAAIMEQLSAVADAAGHITVQFSAVTDNALVNGIELFDGTLPPQPAHATHAFSTVINAGGGAIGSFAADTGYTGGATYDSSAPVDTSAVVSPAPEGVYQSVRYGTFTYRVPQLTPAASYTVRLHFNEPYWGAGTNGGGIGSRVFNVAINNSPVLTNFDVFAAAGGANKANVQEFVVPADAQGTIAIRFTTLTDNAMVSGIEVEPTVP